MFGTPGRRRLVTSTSRAVRRLWGRREPVVIDMREYNANFTKK